MIKQPKIFDGKESSIVIPIVGMAAQGIAYVLLLFMAVLFSALKISTSSILFEILIIVLISIPLIGFFGLFVAFRNIIFNGLTKPTVLGITYNLIYLLGNGVLYVVVYFLAKYGASV
ncbi:hypothetical protein [Sulfurovum sp.]|uniref:hypothetical protein n=1 Tax=Sulfurovum sp. TaxID=1969726 RepID=UPI00356A3739